MPVLRNETHIDVKGQKGAFQTTNILALSVHLVFVNHTTLRDQVQCLLVALKKGAYADIILVNGNPLKDLDLVADPATKFDLIMKDGEIYKNEVD